MCTRSHPYSHPFHSRIFPLFFSRKWETYKTFEFELTKIAKKLHNKQMPVRPLKTISPLYSKFFCIPEPTDFYFYFKLFLLHATTRSITWLGIVWTEFPAISPLGASDIFFLILYFILLWFESEAMEANSCVPSLPPHLPIPHLTFTSSPLWFSLSLFFCFLTSRNKFSGYFSRFI